jgi:hypothetical protein
MAARLSRSAALPVRGRKNPAGGQPLYIWRLSGKILPPTAKYLRESPTAAYGYCGMFGNGQSAPAKAILFSD